MGVPAETIILWTIRNKKTGLWLSAKDGTGFFWGEWYLRHAFKFEQHARQVSDVLRKTGEPTRLVKLSRHRKMKD